MYVLICTLGTVYEYNNIIDLISLFIISIMLTPLRLSFRSGGGLFSLPTNLAMSMQQLVHAVECVCTDSGTSCGGGAGGWSSTLVRQDLLLDCIIAFVTK